MKPLAIDLFSGLGGWAEGLEEQGFDVIRVDIADMFAETGTPKPERCLLMLQDVLTFHGSQAKDAALIVASPPCQEFSYMAMPWTRAKAIAAALRGDGDFPEAYRGSRTMADLTALFDACFRIQREACEASGRHIPLLVENVRGAIPWVGRSRWNFGSFHLWGDVPAIMPSPARRDAVKVGGIKWYHPDDPRHVVGQGFNTIADRQNREGQKVPGFRFDGSGGSFQTASVDGMKGAGGSWVGHGYQPHQHGRNTGSGSKARKAASAKIAKIPLALSRFIGCVYHP